MNISFESLKALLTPEDLITLILTVLLALLMLILSDKAVRFIKFRRTASKGPANIRTFIKEANMEMTHHSNWVKLISGIGPMLGILGTIFGIQITLGGISAGENGLKLEGLGVALNTTAAGVLVACFGLFVTCMIRVMTRNIIMKAVFEARKGGNWT